MIEDTVDIRWTQLASSLGYSTELAMWEDLYVNQNRSVKALGKILNAGSSTIIRRLFICGIERRARGGKNNISSAQIRFYHLDQRWVMLAPIGDIAYVLDSSKAAVYRMMKER